jgi:hypothetical protein
VPILEEALKLMTHQVTCDVWHKAQDKHAKLEEDRFHLLAFEARLASLRILGATWPVIVAVNGN